MPTRERSAGRISAAGARRTPQTNLRARLATVVLVLGLASSALVVRAVDLQFVRTGFYQAQGDQRFLRDRAIPVSRGMITDRNGEPLAISTPVESIWAQPQELLAHRARLPELARALGVNADELEQRLAQRVDREFLYLRRHLPPDRAAEILALDIPGVNAQREFRRYYPAGEVLAHVLGFTNIDDAGQEGLELAFDDWLSGKPGLKRIVQDRRGRVVENVELLREPEPGRALRLSIDRRVQYLAYRELKAALAEHQASAGTMVIVDVASGEILAMANAPSYNPNLRGSGDAAARRNRAVTDVFEPGSVIKAFTVAAGIESGKFGAGTLIDTAPGWMPVANHVVRDVRNYGVVDLTRLLTKSSNIASVRIALALDNAHLHDVYRRFGFGQPTGSGFPGESPGVLPPARSWGLLEKATLSYGYGLSVTPLQMAMAYAALANGGRLRAPTFVAGQQSADAAVLDPQIAAEILRMLETVVQPGGTGTLAAVPNYSVAGKTGTTRKLMPGGYQSRYISVFAGVIPVDKPRLAGVVVIDDPRAGAYFGGLVAAPVFGRVMTGATRLLDVPPDRFQLQLAAASTPSLEPPLALAEQFAEGVAP